MTLLVVDLDENPSESLSLQLSRCGLRADLVIPSQVSDYLKLHDPKLVIISAAVASAQANAQSTNAATAEALLLCENLMSTKQNLRLVLATSLAQLNRATLLQMLRIHLMDVLELPAPDAEVAQRVQTLMSRGDNARRDAAQLAELERDQRAGRYIQTRMLPPSPMAIDGYRLRHKLFPSLLLSGDFVDYFRIAESHFIFYMADVSGHGASSAFVTVLLKNFSRRLRREYHPRMLQNPSQILSWLNNELLENKIDKHVAIILGVMNIEDGHLRLVNAGHFPLPIITRDGHASFLESRGKPVGLFQQVEYEAATRSLNGNDRLLLVSDGILEIMPVTSLKEKEEILLQAAEEVCRTNKPFWELLGIEEALPAPDDISCLTILRVA